MFRVVPLFARRARAFSSNPATEVAATTPRSRRLMALTKRTLFEELALCNDAKLAPHTPRELVDVEFPFEALSGGSVRDVAGLRHQSLRAAVAAWPAPQLWLVTQKRAFAQPLVRTWTEGVASLDVALRPLVCELVVVAELPWRVAGRLVERHVAKSTPVADRARLLHRYGALSDSAIAALGGLQWHVLPTALLVDAAGRIRWRTAGLCEAADVQAIAALMPDLSASK
jgi:hypothetical protein